MSVLSRKWTLGSSSQVTAHNMREWSVDNWADFKKLQRVKFHELFPV